MLDLEMLNRLARPSGAYLGPRPPSLDEVFARVVRDGWAPRSVAYGSELAGLQIARTHGVCLEPLIVDGDEVFIDPHATALSGDLVQVAVSQRFADLQNAGHMPGQREWRKGDRWIKLFVDYHSVPMLLENKGAGAVSLLGGETPEAVVPLAVVRNIRRNGRLLFQPESGESITRRSAIAAIPAALVGFGALAGCDDQGLLLPPCSVDDDAGRCAHIADNAATALYTATAAGPYSVTSVSAGTLVLASSLLSLPNVDDSSQAWEVTVTMEVADNEATNYGGVGSVSTVYDSHNPIGPSDSFQYGAVSPCPNSRTPMTMTAVFNGTVSTITTNTINLFATFTAGGVTVTAWNINVRATLIKR